MLIAEKVRVRFAPSPTGNLHIGGLRTALFNWLFAKSKGGAFLVRIEDTDFERSEEKYTEGILNSLRWCSLISDEPLIFQSERLQIYSELANQLITEGKAYKCYCSPEELKMRLNPEDEYKKYDNRCRNQIKSDKSDYVIRFKIPENIERVEYYDLIKGELAFDTDQFDDFIIVRSDGVPTYNFAVVIDDNFMAITHILRGEEHISNTPKQIFLYQALGFKMPNFGHFPMILAPDGTKLSKRFGATGVEEYRKVGFLADALCNYLVRLGWSYGDKEIFSREELVEYFSIEHVGKKGSIFDIKKLEWVNSVYIKQDSALGLLDKIKGDVEPDFEKHFSNWNQEQILNALDLYKERSKTLGELAFQCKLIYEGPKDFNFGSEVNSKVLNMDKSTLTYLEELIKRIGGSNFNNEDITNIIKNLCNDFTIKMQDIAIPIRIALTGGLSSPSIADLMVLIGKEDTLKKIDNFRSYLIFILKQEP